MNVLAYNTIFDFTEQENPYGLCVWVRELDALHTLTTHTVWFPTHAERNAAVKVFQEIGVRLAEPLPI